MPVICEGCGQRVPIPEGYRRKKIQCPCGVFCTVPESARQEADAPGVAGASSLSPGGPRRGFVPQPRPPAEEEAEHLLLDEDAPAPPREPPRSRDPEQDGRPEPAPKRAVEMRFNCRRCGLLVRRQGECPSCDADKVPAAGEEPVRWPSKDEQEEGEEDSSPYIVEGGVEVQCPECCLMLPPASVLCVRCGFHLKKRKKVAKTYQPMDRDWEPNASRQKRLTIFWSGEVVALVLGLIGVFGAGADLGVFAGSFLVFTMMMAFLLGTFARIQLTRDSRGRVRLTKTWRVFFFARQPEAIDPRGYEGISSGVHRDVTFWDYFICLSLFVSGIIPGILWWYFTFYKVTYHVSLSRDHGYPAYLLYSGWSQAQMQEVAAALRDATRLPYHDKS